MLRSKSHNNDNPAMVPLFGCIRANIIYPNLSHGSWWRAFLSSDMIWINYSSYNWLVSSYQTRLFYTQDIIPSVVIDSIYSISKILFVCFVLFYSKPCLCTITHTADNTLKFKVWNSLVCFHEQWYCSKIPGAHNAHESEITLRIYKMI